MKRDDFGMRIDEIRELATKYSKPDLARMVKMGLIDPQRALMAGMMIDRIAKSAMQPPQTTVAEDVLAAPTTAQGQIPPGIMGAPQAPAPSPGVAGLPSGMQNMAGGGIVAFAEGGDTDDIPGYAGDKQSLVDSRRDPAMKIDPRVQAKRDRDRYEILAQELRDAQARMMRGDPGAKADFQAIQREMRSVKPAPSAGLTSLIPLPSAEAAPMAAKAAPVSAPVEEEAAYDPMTGLRITGPEPKPYDPRIKPGTAYEPNIIRDILQGGPGAKPAAPSEPQVTKPAPAAPSKFEASPAQERAAPTVIPEAEIPTPKPIEAQQIAVPKERTLKEESADIQAAYKEFDVDTDMYKNQMKELEGKKASLAQRKEQALGAALVSFGLGLAGARQGQVFQQLNNEGQKALGQYMNSMDKLAENEDRIDMLNRQLQMAENNFRRTGADSALNQMRARRERIDQIEAKNAELRQRAAEHQATVEASVYQTKVGADVRRDVAAAQAMARGIAASKAGQLTRYQRFGIEQQLRTELEPKLREQYKNHPNPDKKVAEELQKQINSRIAALESQPAGYGGSPPQDMFADWTVEGM